MSQKISFIIPHKGREEMLLQTLESIAQQDFPLDQLQVIVVSQNKSASELLTHFNKKFDLEVIFNEDERTISHSRNLGAMHASGAFFAFLDADIQLSNNWVSAMLDVLQNNDKVVLASAMQVNSENAPPLERIRTALSNAELDTTVAFLPGRNLFLSRDVFERVGGFPEHLLTCEDYYFTDKVNQLGELFYTSSAQYIHIGEDKAFIPMFKKEIWRGQSNLASLSGRRIPLREWPSFLIPFAVCLGVLLGIGFTITEQPVYASSAFAIGLLPLLVYTLRLKSLTKGDVGWLSCLLFYILYFPARSMGTVIGLGYSVGTSSHK